MGRVCPSAWLCIGWTSDLDCMGGVFLWVLSLSPYLGWGIRSRHADLGAVHLLLVCSIGCSLTVL